jgi:N-acyl-D-aspartate/D-glutamate deacylase
MVLRSLFAAAPSLLQRGCLSLAIGCLWVTSAWAQDYEVLIRGGRIVDGTGNPWYYGDVAVNDGKIAAIGKFGDADAARIIDATGMVVSPGFIDLHTHTNLLGNPLGQSKIRQGVTLDVMGEGGSVAPRDGLPNDGEQTWTTFTEYFDLLEKQGIAMNIISHVGEGQVRRVVKGYDPSPATPEELEKMKALVTRSLREGAWGIVNMFESGGPAYPEETLALAQVVADHGSVYFSHIGSEGYEQEKELAFAMRVAEEVGLPVHILHLKIRGEELWPKLPEQVAMLNAARERGLDITADVYPYTAMSHGWNANFPVWMREKGPEQFAAYLNDSSLRDRIKSDPEFIAFSQEHGWWEGIAMSRARSPELKQYEGLRVAEIAKLRGEADPADTLISLMAIEGGSIGGVFHNQDEANVRLVLSQPWVAPASDGSAVDLDVQGVPHPRSFGTNARVLGKYVREEKLLTLEDAIRKMTSLPAQILGLRERGQLAPGFAADIVVFDPEVVRDTNSFEQPKSYAIGVPYVLVNGVLVIEGGEPTGQLPGKVLRGPAYVKDD